MRSSVSLGAVNICPSPRAGQLWRLQLTDRPEAREGVKGGNFQAPCAGMEERVGEGKWGEHSRHRSLGPPWANMLPSLTGHLEQAARVAAAGSTLLTRRQKHPAVAVGCWLANQQFSSGVGGDVIPERTVDNIWRHFGMLGFERKVYWHRGGYPQEYCSVFYRVPDNNSPKTPPQQQRVTKSPNINPRLDGTKVQ